MLFGVCYIWSIDSICELKYNFGMIFQRLESHTYFVLTFHLFLIPFNQTTLKHVKLMFLYINT